MMAYRAAGIDIPRTSQEQWAWGPQVPASQVRARATWCSSRARTARPTAPGHVGLVIGKDTMIEAYATGFPIRISHSARAAAAGDGTVVGFTRPWAHSGVRLTSMQTGG